MAGNFLALIRKVDPTGEKHKTVFAFLKYHIKKFI
jgi:hypothetical protein